MLVVATVGLLTAGCGKSTQQQAKDSVCGARARIAESVNELAALTNPAAAANQVQGDLVAIGANLRQITDAEANLDSPQRQRVATAVEAFRSEATVITGKLLLSQRLSVTGANPELRADLDRLASRYEATLATIECG